MLYIARKSLTRFVCLLLLVGIVAGLFIASPDREQSDVAVIARTLLDKVIIVDPGHGGIDPGALSASGLLEKDIVLQICFLLRDLLESAGANVVMTRQSDRSLSELPPDARVRAHKQEDLKQRVAIAREHTADLFISIHCNGSPSSRWSGAQTFYYPGNSEHNRVLALSIQKEVVRLVGRTNRQAQKIEHQYILKQLEIPAVNVEVGFMSHPEEAKLLNDPAYQRKLAWAVFVGLVKFLAAEEAGKFGE